MDYLFAFLGAGAAFLILDLIWLGLIASGFYKQQMGDLMAPRFNLPGAIAFYLIYLLGVMIFVIEPAMGGAVISDVALRGAMFGFFCYATYDLTCLAVMRNYPAKLAIIDIIWGTLLTASASAAGFFAASLL